MAFPAYMLHGITDTSILKVAEPRQQVIYLHCIGQSTAMDCSTYIMHMCEAKLIAKQIACKCGFSTRAQFQ